MQIRFMHEKVYTKTMLVNSTTITYVILFSGISNVQTFNADNEIFLHIPRVLVLLQVPPQITMYEAQMLPMKPTM